MNVSPEQIKAARLLLDWTQEKLSNEAGVGVEAVESVERGDSSIGPESVSLITTALEAAGIEFFNKDEGGPGVTLRNDGK